MEFKFKFNPEEHSKVKEEREIKKEEDKIIKNPKIPVPEFSKDYFQGQQELDDENERIYKGELGKDGGPKFVSIEDVPEEQFAVEEDEKEDDGEIEEDQEEEIVSSNAPNVENGNAGFYHGVGAAHAGPANKGLYFHNKKESDKRNKDSVTGSQVSFIKEGKTKRPRIENN